MVYIIAFIVDDCNCIDEKYDKTEQTHVNLKQDDSKEKKKKKNPTPLLYQLSTKS